MQGQRLQLLPRPSAETQRLEMNAAETTERIKIGTEQDYKIRNGYRVVAKDTSSGRPWMWYAPDLESAKMLAQTLAEETGQEVDISKYVGSVRLVKRPTEFVPASDAETGK